MDGQGESREQEQRIDQMQRHRDRPGQRIIVGYPFGEDDCRPYQGLDDDGNTREHGAEPRLVAFRGSAPHPGDENEDEHEGNAAHEPMAELDCRGPFELRNHLSAAGGP